MKSHKPVELDFNQIPTWFDKLIKLLSPYGFEEGLAKYKKTKQFSDPVTSTHSLRRRHPWFDVIARYRELEGRIDNLTEDEKFAFECVAFDSIKLEIVLRETEMSDKVKKQILRNLVNLDTANPAMVEILTAYHYWRCHAEIVWIDSDTTDTEFRVKLSGVEFVVECKHLGFDTGKPIESRSFERLSNSFGKLVTKQDVSGHILVNLKGKLPNHDSAIDDLASEINEGVKRGDKCFNLKNNIGVVELTIQAAGGIIANFCNARDFAQSFAPGARQAIYSKSPDGNVSPLIFSVQSELLKSTLTKLRKRLGDAKSQIGEKRIGLIFVHWEELESGDVERLRQDTPFKLFNEKFLQDSKNVAGVCYGAGPFSRVQNRDGIFNEAVEYLNTQVQLPEGFSFINRGDLGDTGIVIVSGDVLNALHNRLPNK